MTKAGVAGRLAAAFCLLFVWAGSAAGAQTTDWISGLPREAIHIQA